eukprot:c13845_g1_i2.p1 GENE.c13845_g1_i2~~c13845_g1_i2.p1  ORF type:complete len:114 (+),score=20.79 c13845_g1_i2:54-395(+)
MRVGVVLCMETPAHMLPEHGRYGDMFTNLLQAVDPRIRVDLFDAFTTARCLPSPSDPNIDCFLISGRFHTHNVTIDLACELAKNRKLSHFFHLFFHQFKQNKKTQSICSLRPG